jgi:hypothetical protein
VQALTSAAAASAIPTRKTLVLIPALAVRTLIVSSP